MREAATEGASIGFKIKDANICIDAKINTEAQTAMFVSNAESCYVVYVNGSNASDIEFIQVLKDTNYFNINIEQKLTEFFKKEFILQIVSKEITIKK